APIALVGASVAKSFAGAGPRGAGTVITAVLLGLAVLMVTLVCVKPFVVSRMQNIVWSKTGNSHLRFYSTLRFRSLLWLSLKNWLLVVLTLGLYWPFATVAMTRLRLEAVTVKTRLDPSQLVADVHQASAEAAGDAAGDFFGVDVGL
ncbi:DUF898 family protein, partial [Rhodoferax sp.]|uniref:DUF898 family protein n=1 Tax=Rhodoferax sp. TaxID=50421 RepID=UPI00260C900C